MSVRLRLSGPGKRDAGSGAASVQSPPSVKLSVSTAGTSTGGTTVAADSQPTSAGVPSSATASEPATGSKRKAPPSLTALVGDPDLVLESRPKRIQRGRETVVESVERTQELGRKLLKEMKDARLKGRQIIEQFLVLPDAKEFPEYYEEILLPMAMDIIEEKLENGEYKVMSELEGDLLRMVANAKTYNERKSQIYEDAERLKKQVIGFMTEHNPAYRNPRFMGKPTPIPSTVKARAKSGVLLRTPSLSLSTGKGHDQERNRDEDEADGADRSGDAGEGDESMVGANEGEKPKAPDVDVGKVDRVGDDGGGGGGGGGGAVNKRAEANKETSEKKVEGGEDDEEEDTSWIPDFSGMTFREAQETIVQSLMNYVDPESGIDIYAPFVNLPPRSLTQYYRVITHPMSLTNLLRKTKGVHQGRNQPKKGTFFETWRQFTHQASYIWKNARKFNEEGSDIVLLVGDLEDHFWGLVEAAKKHVYAPEGEPEEGEEDEGEDEGGDAGDAGAAPPSASGLGEEKDESKGAASTPSGSSTTATPRLRIKGPPRPSIKLRLSAARKSVSAGSDEKKSPVSTPTGVSTTNTTTITGSTTKPATITLPSSARKKAAAPPADAAVPVAPANVGTPSDRPQSRHARGTSRQASSSVGPSGSGEGKEKGRFDGLRDRSVSAAPRESIERGGSVTASSMLSHTTPRKSNRSASKGLTPARSSVRATSRGRDVAMDGKGKGGAEAEEEEDGEDGDEGDVTMGGDDDVTGALGDGTKPANTAESVASPAMPPPPPPRPNPNPFNKSAGLARPAGQVALLPSITIRSHTPGGGRQGHHHNQHHPHYPHQHHQQQQQQQYGHPGHAVSEPRPVTMHIPTSPSSITFSATAFLPPGHRYVEVIPTVPLAGALDAMANSLPPLNNGHTGGGGGAAAAGAGGPGGAAGGGGGGGGGAGGGAGHIAVPPPPRPYRIIVTVNGEATNQIMRASSPVPERRARPVGSTKGANGSLPNGGSASPPSGPNLGPIPSLPPPPPPPHGHSHALLASPLHGQIQRQHQHHQPVRDSSRPVYGAVLVPGIVNRIEVEVIAGPASARTTARVAKESVQWEKAVLFVYVGA